MRTINKQIGRTLQFTGLLLLLLLGSTQLASADVVAIERVSISDIGGIEVNTDGNQVSISSDGRFIAFVHGGGGGSEGVVYVRDRDTNTTTLISPSGLLPHISDNGRFVAFQSRDGGLVSGDTNDVDDVFVHDRDTGETTRVSVHSDGTEGIGVDFGGFGFLFLGSSSGHISNDGRFVTFSSYSPNLVDDDTNDSSDLFVHDRNTGETTRLAIAGSGTEANGDSTAYGASSDGRFVTFISLASNLVSGDTNGKQDVFVHDRDTGTTTRVSVASDGTEGDNDSGNPSISSNGRFIAFSSQARNLVSGDTNNKADVFVHDRNTGETTRVSVASGGTQLTYQSGEPSISNDGRFIAFKAQTGNLGGTSWDVFVHNRNANETTRLSDPEGNAPVVSGNGRFVVFTNASNSAVIYDLDTDTVEPVSFNHGGQEGYYESTTASISADGRFVAFQSESPNLVSGDTNNAPDIFVHDRQTGETTRVSVASDGTQSVGEYDYFSGSFLGSYAPSISGDGRFIAFESHATNLVSGDTNSKVDIFVHDRQTGTTTRVSVDSSSNQATGNSRNPSISSDGRFVAFQSDAGLLVSNDINGWTDIFVHDRNTGETTRVSINSNDDQGNRASAGPSISGDGRFVAFQSDATNLASGDTNGLEDIFVHDRNTGETTRISVDSDGNGANNSSFTASLSSDGRFVAFVSSASNLVGDDNNGQGDIFVHDRNTGETTRISMSSTGDEGNGQSHFPVISGDGRFVTFSSQASNLVNGDTNSRADIFVHDRQTGTTERVSVTSSGTQGNSDSFDPSISSDGNFVAFASQASNLVSNDTNGGFDIFVAELQTVPPPVPDAGGPYSVAEGGSTSLDASATTDPDQDPATLTYEWDFDGDNSYDDATGITPSFSAATLDGPSSVTVGLKVTNSAGGSATTTATITISNVNPTISSVSNNGPVGEGSNATITVSATDVAGAADPLSYEFDCDSDGSYDVGPQASNSTSCPTGGSDTEVTVRVTDGDGGEAIDSTTVSVNNLNPTISSVANSGPAAEGSNVTISVVANDADSLSYEFDCDGDGDYEVGPQASSSTSCTMGDDGSTQVNIRVTDGDGGEATDSTTVTVTNANPTINSVSNNGPIDEGNNVTITVNASDVDSLSYEFDCDDDGSYEVGPQASNSTTCFFTDQTSAPLRSANAATTLSGWVNVRVSDGEGGEATDSTIVVVNNANPTFSSISNNGPVNEFSSVTITVNASDPAGTADTLSYEFDCDNDNSYEVGPQASNSTVCAVGDNGSLKVNVRVSDEDGGKATGGIIVTVNNVNPTISSVTNNGPVDEGNNVTITVTASDVAGAADPLSYEFDCDGDNDYEVGPQSSNSTSCAMSSSGPVNVRVSDDDGGEATDSTTVTVNNLDPTISSVSNDGPITEGNSVTISVDASDPADTLSYEFDCDGDGDYEVGPQASSSTSCTFNDQTSGAVEDNGRSAALGYGWVTVRVSDGDGGEATDSTFVNVSNVDPTITEVSNDGPIDEGNSVTITVTASDPAGDSDPLSYEFDCDGDGDYEVGPQPSNSTSCFFGDQTGSDAFDAFRPPSLPGQVNVRVTDGDGGEATEATFVVVNNVDPTIHAVSNDGPVQLDDEVTITVTASDPAGENDPLSYEFDCDNDNVYEIGPQAENSAVCSYTTVADHQVNVRVTDGDGGEATSQTIVEIYLPATCDITADYVTVIYGTAKNDKLVGTPGNDIIFGYAGDDRIEGMGGNDCLIGGPGNDRLYGDDGNDLLWGGEVDNSSVYVRRDRDKLYGDDGDDELYGGGDRDHIDAGDGDDLAYGGDGDDKIYGKDGDDVLHGENGRDNMRGDDGNDILTGGADRDNLQGNDGDDELAGDDGDDKLYGGKGDDALDGGADRDRLDGSSGTDSCVRGESLRGCESDSEEL